MSVSKKLRFEVFKRDSFTCQYCGAKAPDAVLELDHIQPRAAEGGDDLLNLITSCHDCNSGKSDRRLCDASVVEKQRAQLEQLQERREQLEMLLEWQKELLSLDAYAVEEVAKIWAQLVPGYDLNEYGRQDLKKILKKHSLSEVVDAVRTSTTQYLEFDDGKPTKESVEKAWRYVAKICSVTAAAKDKPYLKDLLYIRGILRNRLHYVNEREALRLLEEAVGLGATIESLRTFARTARNWTDWRLGVEAFISEHSPKDEVSSEGA